MKNEIVSKPEIKLVGITIKTNNNDEMDPERAKIGPLVARYESENIAKSIPHRLHSGVTYSVYTNYDSNELGDYTYFIGEEVSMTYDIPKSLTLLTIPASEYQKFTTEPGKMPEVVIEAWQEIWAMTREELGGVRKFVADFEIYDQKACDPSNAIVDIYIGII